MKYSFKIAILFSLNLTSLIAQKGLSQTTEMNKIDFKNWEVKSEFNLDNYHNAQINSQIETSDLSDLFQATSLRITLYSEKLSETNSLNQSQISTASLQSNIPDPYDKTISQTASDLQFHSQIESEEDQPILEDPEEVKPKDETPESASSGGGNLAEQSQNPIANLISVPFQNNTNFGVGQLDRTQNILNIQPVIPIELNDDWLLVSRTILPVIYQPALTSTQYSHFGLGDLNPQLFFVPKNDSKITYGAGPVFLLPTATDDSLGTGKWGIGPTAVIVVTDAPWVYGGLVNNIWSVAGDSDRPDVNQFLLQPFINYNLSDGWYLVSAPIITANWNASSGNQWTIPIGGGFGRIFNIGKQPVNASLQAYWNAETPEGGADWTLRTQFQLLFPTGK